MKFEQIQVKIWKMKHRYAGRKPQKKKCKRERWNYLQTSELVSLWIENMSVVESSQCNKGWRFIQKKCQSLATKKPNFNAKTKFTTSKTLTRMQSWTIAKVGKHHKRRPSLMSYDVLSSRDVVNTPERKEVGFARRVSRKH